MTKRPKPWERQAADTHKSWGAFAAYRDMGEKRSVKRLMAEGGRKATHGRWIQEWCRKHNWVERAAAYDAHMDGIRVKEAEVAHKRWARKQLKAARLMHKKGVEAMKAQLLPLGPNEARMYVETSTKLQRLITGEATERTETREMMGIEEFRAYQQKAREGDDEA